MSRIILMIMVCYALLIIIHTGDNTYWRDLNKYQIIINFDKLGAFPYFYSAKV